MATGTARRILALALCTLAAVTAAPAGAATAPGNAPGAAPGTSAGSDSSTIRLAVLSSRPAVVSGGDALVRVIVPAGIPLDAVRVQRGSDDVTGDFRPGAATRTLEGLVDGLRIGRTTLTAKAPWHDASGRLVVTNHPVTGPVFAGPHEQPFICDTAEFVLVTGEKLGPPLDDDCSARTRVDHVYRTTAGAFAPLPADTNRPADLTWTTTSTGTRVPYIVRVESGTANRAIYETAVLHDPEADQPDPWHRSPGWNDRLVYTFGGGCAGGWFVQGRSHRRRARRRNAASGIRRRVRLPQRLRAELQRSAGRRDDEHGQGTLRRGVRSAGVHDRLRLLGRVVPGTPDRRQLPRPPRRHHRGMQLSGGGVRHHPHRDRRAVARPLLPGRGAGHVHPGGAAGGVGLRGLGEHRQPRRRRRSDRPAHLLSRATSGGVAV